jgi:hypothetical protein
VKGASGLRRARVEVGVQTPSQHRDELGLNHNQLVERLRVDRHGLLDTPEVNPCGSCTATSLSLKE